jgi:hypothetical protein
LCGEAGARRGAECVTRAERGGGTGGGAIEGVGKDAGGTCFLIRVGTCFASVDGASNSISNDGATFDAAPAADPNLVVDCARTISRSPTSLGAPPSRLTRGGDASSPRGRERSSRECLSPSTRKTSAAAAAAAARAPSSSSRRAAAAFGVSGAGCATSAAISSTIAFEVSSTITLEVSSTITLEVSSTITLEVSSTIALEARLRRIRLIGIVVFRCSSFGFADWRMCMIDVSTSDPGTWATLLL